MKTRQIGRSQHVHALQRPPVAAPEPRPAPPAGARHGVLPVARGGAATNGTTVARLTFDDAQRAELERLAMEWGAPP